jgi:hypothetical protein
MKLIRVLVMVSLLALPMFAQTITVRGLVTDESGAIVPGSSQAYLALIKPFRHAFIYPAWIGRICRRWQEERAG